MKRVSSKFLILSCFLPLLFGGSIYLLFRIDKLVMFKWIDFFLLIDELQSLRQYMIQYKLLIPNWFIYSLPNGLWMFSYISLILWMWGNKINKQNIFWLLIMPLIAILSEIGQEFNYIQGVFDYIDILFYSLGLVLSLIFNYLFINLNFNKYEK